MTGTVLLPNDSVVLSRATRPGVLLVADGSCPQIRELLASADAPVLWLDGTVSPLLAVSRALECERLHGLSIHTLHWFSHGAPGQLRVGEEWIHRTSLQENAHLLSRWGLRDLALWSCEAGADQEFVALWEELTAATVWSSSEPLGRLEDGTSNWSLASASGTALSTPPITTTILYAWGGQLTVNYTSTDGLGDNDVNDVYVSGDTIYAATDGGLSISADNGKSWTNYTTNEGLKGDIVNSVYESGGAIYVASQGGLSISTDNGNKWSQVDLGYRLAPYVYDVYESDGIIYAGTNDVSGGGLSISTDGENNFSNRSIRNGLGNNIVPDVYVSGGVIYAATNGGLSISTDKGSTFQNYTTENGLASNSVQGVYESDGTIYAATNLGLSISTNNGTSFTTYTTDNGLGGPSVRDVYASDGTIYAATNAGLSISTDNGKTFKNYRNGLGSSSTTSVHESGGTVYVATEGGLSIAAPPTLETSTPTDDAAGVAVDNDLILTFSENVSAGSGDILIKKTSDNSTVATIPIGDPQVTISGSSITINPANDLDAETSYYLEIAPGVIQGGLGTKYAGLTTSTDLNFTTAAAPDTTAPELNATPGNQIPELYSTSPVDDSKNVEPDEEGIYNIYLLYDDGEELFPSPTGQEKIKIVESETSEVVEEFNVFNFQQTWRLTESEVGVTIVELYASKLEGEKEYIVQIEENSLTNGQIGVSSNSTLNFTTAAAPDTTAPTLSSSTPADNARAVAIDSGIELTFSEEVKAGSGSIKIWKNQGDLVEPELHESIDVSSDQVTIIDNTVTIKPSQDLDYSSLYFIQIGNEALLDQADNYFAGISDSGTLNFVTAAAPDTTAPTLSSSTPADNARAVAIDSGIELTFSEEVKAGSGKFAIWKEGATTYSLHESPIEALSDQVTIDGNIVTIKPSKLLDYSSNYYISSDSKALLDQAGNPFAGISGRTTLNFTTAAAPDTTAPSLSSSTPVDNATAVAIGSDVVLTFSEEVKAGTGNIIIKKSVDDSTVATIPVTDGQVSISGDTVTINPTADLENSTDYYIVIDADALDDAAGNAYAGISDSTTLNFTTVAAPAAPAPSGNSTVAASAPPQPSSTTPDPEPAETVDTTPIDPAPAGTNIQPVDDDGDGIREVVTAPDGTSVDGNRDGIADATQSDVAGLRLINDGAASGDYGAISVAEGIQLQDVTLTSAETDGGIPVTTRGGGTLVTTTPEGISNAFAGVVSFNAAGVTPGGTTQATLSLPTGLPAGTGNAYLRFNYLTNRFEEFVDANGNPLYAFLDSDGDGIVDAVSLTLTDGDPAWDGDGVANGVVVDPGFLGSGERSFTGTQRRDTLTGNVLANAIHGKGGKDWIDGDLGNDTLKGGDGNDRLHGGEGADQIRGGDGQDHFLYTAAADSLNSSRDTVWFDKKDRFDFSAFDGDSTAEGRQALSFIGKSAFSGSSGELRATRSVVEVDLNGDAVADFTVVLHGKGLLTAGNFIL